MKKKIIIGVSAALVLATGAFFLFQRGNNTPQYKTEKMSKGDIRQSVTATGTLSAVVSVLVGTQVSGTIQKLYVDYNTVVKKGQLLAQIDPSLFEAQVAQARANLEASRANVEKAITAVADSKRTYERNKTLLARNLIAQSDLDSSQTSYDSNMAQLSAARAQVEQVKAALKTAEINLRYTRIVSPVNGMVISRNVDVGQTVAASFQTPTLFTIAQDLTQMQIDTSVDEADIGKIRVDQPVEFTVDAYPDLTFKGKVSEVRNAPTTVQNVVTYDVVVKVHNPEFKLKPGMTANVSITTATKSGVLRIPNAALRLRLPEKGSAPSGQKTDGSASGPIVWTLEGKKPKRARIAAGISDGSYTEVVSGDLKEGQEIIVEAAGIEKKGNTPPSPRFFR